MENYPEIFIPFYGNVADSPIVRTLKHSGVPFKLVTHENNHHDASAVEEHFGVSVVRAHKKCNGSYANLLNWIRFAMASDQEWFWIIHPYVSRFMLCSSSKSKKSTNKGESLGGKVIVPSIVLQYKYPITRQAIAKTKNVNDTGKPVMVSLKISNLNQELSESTLHIGEPFALCLNNACIPTDIQFRGYIHEISDFQLQLSSRGLIISSPQTISVFFDASLFDLEISRLRFFCIANKKADSENFVFRAIWGTQICDLQSTLCSETAMSDEKKPSTALRIHWNKAKNPVPNEIEQITCVRVVEGFHAPKANESHSLPQGFYVYSILDDVESRISSSDELSYEQNDPQITIDIPSEVPVQSKKLLQKKVRWADALTSEHESADWRAHPNDISAETQYPENSPDENLSTCCEDSPSLAVSDDDISLIASSQISELPCDSNQSLYRPKLAHVIKQIQIVIENRWEDSATPSPPDQKPLPVAMIYDASTDIICMEWNGLLSVEYLDNDTDSIEALISLFSDGRFTKICLGTNDIHLEIQKFQLARGAKTVSPQNVFDYSLAAFYSGESIPRVAEILQSARQFTHESDRIARSALISMSSHFENLVCMFYRDGSYPGYETMNKAAFVLVQMTCAGFVINIDELHETYKLVKSVVGHSELKRRTQEDMIFMCKSLDRWLLLLKNDAHHNDTSRTSIYCKIFHDLISGRISCAHNIDLLFTLELPSEVNLSTEFEQRDPIVIPSLQRSVQSPRGMAFLRLQFQNLDFQIFAILSEEPNMLCLLQQEIDIVMFFMHAMERSSIDFQNALNEYKPPRGSLYSEKQIQTLVMGCLYGLNLSRIALELNLPWEKVQSIVQYFNALFPETDRFREKVAHECGMNGEVRTLLGGRKCFPPTDQKRSVVDLNVDNAVKFILQGSVGDVTNTSLVSLHKLRERFSPIPFHVVMQPHDSILVHVDDRFSSYLCSFIIEKACIFPLPQFRVICRAFFGYSYDDMQLIDFKSMPKHNQVPPGILQVCEIE